jgi:uncharacterized protein YidB (DUF937 family)
MGLLDSLLGGSAETPGTPSGTPGGTDPLAGALSALLAQNGGLQGLMSKFSQGGLGDVFSSWVGTGNNQAISASQIQNVLGSGQVQALAAKLGIDPAMVSTLLAQYLPMIIDKLTPQGQINPAADNQQGLAALLPSLLQSLGGESRPT